MMTTDDAWICYSVRWLFNERWETPYVGACPAASFSTLPDANRNSLFVEMITDRETWEAVPNSVHRDETGAVEMRDVIIASMMVKPHFNVNGSVIEPKRKGRSQRLRNNETGTEYSDGAEAARMLGVSISMISKHLNGHSQTVAGTTLSRITA